MIDVYTTATPSGYMMLIALNNLQLSASTYVLSIDKRNRKTVDPYSQTRLLFYRSNGIFAVLKPIAILMSLAEKAGGLLQQWAKELDRVLSRMTALEANLVIQKGLAVLLYEKQSKSRRVVSGQSMVER
jgi:hypothetical protein